MNNIYIYKGNVDDHISVLWFNNTLLKSQISQNIEKQLFTLLAKSAVFCSIAAW